MAHVLSEQRSLFDIPREIAYFNCASLAPLMHEARKAGELALQARQRPWEITRNNWFAGAEQRRELFASLLGTTADAVALVPATSYGLAIAAKNLTAQAGQRVLVIAEDYPSNVYTWREFARRTGAELLTVHRETPEQSWTDAILHALDERVTIVAVPNVHWTDGALIDLAVVGERARRLGARLVVDASQSLGAMPLDLAAIRPDYLVCVGYKWLLGPFGLGYLYVAEQHRQGAPLEENWISRRGSEDFAGLVDYQGEYQPGARRFDVGQRTHFETTPIALAALRRILDWGVSRIAATLMQITGNIEREVVALGVRVIPAKKRGPHMLGLHVPAASRERLAASLKAAGVYVGIRGNAIRVSPHLWTDGEDVARLVTALADALKGPGPAS